MIGQGIMRYLELPSPAHALLVLAPPGAGKSTKAVEAAEYLAALGHRVLWLAPRHDHVPDLRALARHPDWWYEWLPRRLGDPDSGLGQTCRYENQINAWLYRGYEGIEFCKSICGWDYVNKGCPWHLQKRREEPIIVGQHPHLYTGHPLEFHAVIGDESPLQTLAREWVIPERWIVPQGLDPTDALTHLLHDLGGLAERDTRAEGSDLLKLLGGAARVVEACEGSQVPLTAEALSPTLHRADDAERAPFFHLPALVHLLLREGRVAQNNQEYPHRVIVAKGKLILLLRRTVAEGMPRRTIWLDGTGDARLYEQLLGRPVEAVQPELEFRGRVYQVHDSQNGKGSLTVAVRGEDGKPKRDEHGQIETREAAKAKRLRLQADEIARRYPAGRAAVVTHLKLLDHFADWPGPKLHFYAARGTNRLEDCDALIVVGTPQPPLDELDKLARMVWWTRMAPFRVGTKLPWAVRWRCYEYCDAAGRGREIPVGELADEHLNLLLYQLREAEVLQAAHRARPNLHEVDVWLLTNLPVAGLPPAELMSVRELFDAPKGLDFYRWPALLTLADAKRAKGEALRSTEVAAALGIDQVTAVQYLGVLVKDQPERWQWPDDTRVVPVDGRRGRGRPVKVILPRDGGISCRAYMT